MNPKMNIYRKGKKEATRFPDVPLSFGKPELTERAAESQFLRVAF